MPDITDADRYRRAQAHKLIRMGLVELDDSGQLVVTAGMAEMDDGPITPDPVDFEAIQRDTGGG